MYEYISWPCLSPLGSSSPNLKYRKAYEVMQKPGVVLATLALLTHNSLIFFVWDRLKMVMHKAWTTTIVAPKLEGSLCQYYSTTTTGHMKPTFRVSMSLYDSVPGRRELPNQCPKQTIVSSILDTYVILGRNHSRGPLLEQPSSSIAFQNSKSRQIHNKLPQNF